jgi:putative oxidoreductase
MRFILNNPSKYQDIAILIIRVGLGLAFMFVHGIGKITGGPERWGKLGTAVRNVGIDFFLPFWGFMAAVAEFFGGFLLLIGLFFRPATALIIITMLFAAGNHISKGDPFSKVAYPLELAFVLIGLFLMGPGKYSIDKYMKSKSRSRKN